MVGAGDQPADRFVLRPRSAPDAYGVVLDTCVGSERLTGSRGHWRITRDIRCGYLCLRRKWAGRKKVDAECEQNKYEHEPNEKSGRRGPDCLQGTPAMLAEDRLIPVYRLAVCTCLHG